MKERGLFCALLHGIPWAPVRDEHASNRLAGETFMPIVMEAFHDGMYEVASLSRWLFATLVAINGPAAVSALPLKMAGNAQLAGSLAFLLGILSVLGAGVWSLYAFKRVSIAANTMMGYWLTVGGDG